MTSFPAGSREHLPTTGAAEDQDPAAVYPANWRRAAGTLAFHQSICDTASNVAGEMILIPSYPPIGSR